MWFLIHTTITHISNFIFGHHDLRPENHKQIPFKYATSPSPDHTWFHHWSHQYQTMFGNHRRPKFLINEQRESPVNNTIQTCYDRKPTSWPPIKIAYAQPTNLDPLSIESNIEQTWQPKNNPDPRPTSKSHTSSSRVDQTNKPSPRHESPCFEHH